MHEYLHGLYFVEKGGSAGGIQPTFRQDADQSMVVEIPPHILCVLFIYLLELMTTQQPFVHIDYSFMIVWNPEQNKLK